ncbi:MAG: TIGR03936 family radical SAM-associated protein, partial [Acidimicrobiia bacterium]
MRFDKHGKVRFTSHRDVARIWERALRRAGLPVAYTEGFSPRPRLSFGLALSTGYESDGEYFDVDLLDGPDGPADLDGLAGRLDPALPPGMSVQAVRGLEAGAASLQQAVTSCGWRIPVPGVAVAAVEAAADRVLAASSLPTEVERKGEPAIEDVRPGIVELAVEGDGEVSVVLAELATQPRATRPADLLAALDPSWVPGTITRTHQWTLVDGARREPLPLA